DIGEQFYFRPDAGRLLVSPADETPAVPCDAQPEELDIAIAVERMQGVLEFPVRRVAKSWAGLRSFAPDRTPVVGFDPVGSNFFWLAGQGGYGVQTAPALSRNAARLARGDALEHAVTARGVSTEMLSPARFRSEGA
ncbi:MAG TPA: FAD-dependent oxidoreductase, partial [Rhizomicrobium sp.]|nr:FAD-dependent oxidoreductase [Rhizomicrobium sp.]